MRKLFPITLLVALLLFLTSCSLPGTTPKPDFDPENIEYEIVGQEPLYSPEN